MRPLCRDCQWVHVDLLARIFFMRRPYRFAKCKHPDVYGKDGQLWVDGKPEHSWSRYCSHARESEHWCGESGRFFEAQ